MDISELYEKQLQFQKMLGNKVPVDNPSAMAKHLFGLLGEVGEVSQADQRWKTNGRNTHYDRVNKLEEIADCFIYLLNVCIYSDFTDYDLLDAVKEKQDKNIKRYKEK